MLVPSVEIKLGVSPSPRSGPKLVFLVDAQQLSSYVLNLQCKLHHKLGRAFSSFGNGGCQVVLAINPSILHKFTFGICEVSLKVHQVEKGLWHLQFAISDAQVDA
jgi:hypothetical protein